MPGTPARSQPLILVTTSTAPRSDDLLREDSLTGRNYAQAVRAAGGLPLLAPTVDPGSADLYADAADALLLSGGGDVDPARFGAQPEPGLGRVDAERDAFELALYAAFRSAGKPVLGICRGIQLVNVAHGGTLHQHLPAVPGTLQHSQVERGGTPLHAVRLEPDSQLARASGTVELRTNSYHHQGLDRLGDGLRVLGRTADGLVEAVDGTSGAFLLALQWHPEMSWQAHPEHLAPFRLLLQALRGVPAA